MKKAIAAGAVALASAGAIAGCRDGTTTVREIPAAAASSAQPVTTVPALLPPPPSRIGESGRAGTSAVRADGADR